MDETNKILYEVKMYANYKLDLEKYIFSSFKKAQEFMLKKWNEVLHTDDYDDKCIFTIRFSENLATKESYYEEDYAIVKWRKDRQEQWVQFNIEEVTNMMD